MWNVCPKCHHLNSDDVKRCEQCGSKLSSPVPVDQPRRTYEPPAEPTAGPPPNSNFPDSPPRPRTKITEWKANERITVILKRNLLDAWYGPKVPFDERRRNITVTVIFAFALILALAYTASGLCCNAIVWMVFGAMLAWIVYSLFKDRWSEAKTEAVIVLIVLPLFVAAVVPWQTLLDDVEKEPEVPLFVDHLSYSVVDVAHIIVDGYVANEGTGGGEALVRIEAYGGFQDYVNGTQDLTNAFAQTSISTGWMEPGDTKTIHWECTLRYFNSYGEVVWSIMTLPAQ